MLYRRIADSIPHLVWTARTDGWVDFFNQRFHEYSGLRASELEGWAWKQLLHVDDLERCLAAWSRALQSGERYEIDYRLRRADGVYRWHRGTAVPVRDGEGRVARWFGTCTDIEAEVRALRKSEQRFQVFMENSPTAAWIKDSKLRYVYVNRYYESLVGKPTEELAGREDFEVWEPEVARQFRRHDNQVLESGAPMQTVETTVHGCERHWLVIKFPLPDASGAAGVAGMSIDITDRVRAQELVQRYVADVRALLSRLVKAQESERRRLANELHDLIGQNLTALGIELSALKTALPQGSHAARFDGMSRLLDSTVDAIRGVMAELRPPALEFGLVPALCSYAAEFSRRTGIKASMHALGCERRLPADTESALFRIAQEGLTNAAKHSGGKMVDVVLLDYGERIRLTIEDDGHGFADPLGARRAQRGGWGLPAMRERAEALGGNLRVEFPRRGTRIIVEIPSGHAD